MSQQTWVETLVTGQVDGPALANSAAPTSIIPVHAKITFPPGYFDKIGKKLRIRMMGRISCLNPTPGNLTLDMRLGAVIAANGGAMALNAAAAKVNVTWEAILHATVRSLGQGAASQMMFDWKVASEALALAATGVGTLFGPASAPQVGTGWDNTAQQTLDIFATFSIANASNSIQVHSYSVESFN